MNHRPLSVLGLFAGVRTNGPTACDAYRVIFPFKEMTSHGHKADWIPIRAAFFAVEQGKLMPELYDVFVLARMIAPIRRIEETVTFIRTLREAGKVVICEWDDDYTNNHREVTGMGDATVVLRECTAGTASTPFLRDVMAEYNENIFVLPNTIQMSMYRPYVPDEMRVDKELTVGIVGTKTHEEDWKPVAPALMRIANECPDVRVFIGGYVPDYMREIPNLLVAGKVPFGDYPALLRQIDIGLAPLNPDDHFNKSKSGIKALEYMASRRQLSDGRFGGAIPIATSCKVYRRVVNNRHNGMLIKDHYDSNEWYEVIKKLIEDKYLRLRLARQGHDWVVKHRLTEHHWHSWVEAYRALT